MNSALEEPIHHRREVFGGHGLPLNIMPNGVICHNQYYVHKESSMAGSPQAAVHCYYSTRLDKEKTQLPRQTAGDLEQTLIIAEVDWCLSIKLACCTQTHTHTHTHTCWDPASSQTAPFPHYTPAFNSYAVWPKNMLCTSTSAKKNSWVTSARLAAHLHTFVYKCIY